MKQNLELRQNGELHHFLLDQGLLWLLQRYPEHDELSSLRQKIGEKPPREDVFQHATAAKAILISKSRELEPNTYAAIYHVIEDARQITNPKEELP